MDRYSPGVHRGMVLKPLGPFKDLMKTLYGPARPTAAIYTGVPPLPEGVLVLSILIQNSMINFNPE